MSWFVTACRRFLYAAPALLVALTLTALPVLADLQRLGAGSSSLTINSTPITGGATTQLLFNLGGVVSSDADLTFATDTLTATKIANVTVPTGGAFRTNTTATNTALLQAYDNDTGPGYITFGTLTAGNTPTFDLSTATTVGGAPLVQYSLQAGFANLASPADATTYYWGAPSRSTTSSSSQTAPIPIPVTGTLRTVYVRVVNLGTAGSNETSTLSFRLNDTTDTTITSSLATNVSNVGYSATGLTTAVTAGDYFELKWVSPTWGTNPTNVFLVATLYFTAP